MELEIELWMPIILPDSHDICCRSASGVDPHDVKREEGARKQAREDSRTAVSKLYAEVASTADIQHSTALQRAIDSIVVPTGDNVDA